MIRGIVLNIKVLGITKGISLMVNRSLKGKVRNKIIEMSPKKGKDSFWVRTNTTDLDIVKSIFIGQSGKGEYGDIFCEKYKRYLMNANTIVDLGANIGAFTYWCNMKNPSFKTIIAVEPEKNNYDLLLKNIPEKCVTYNAGIWNKKCGLNIMPRETGEWGFIVKPGGGIPAIDINSLIEENNITSIDILKMDIEGSEYEVFQENYEWISKIEMLVVETHERFKPGSEGMVIRRMKEVGFDYEQIGEDFVFTKRGQ